MGKKVLIREASTIVGLSEWELRQGIRSGKYPALMVGKGRGKYVFDIELLETRIEQLMQSNISEKNDQPQSGVRPL